MKTQTEDIKFKIEKAELRIRIAQARREEAEATITEQEAMMEQKAKKHPQAENSLKLWDWTNWTTEPPEEGFDEISFSKKRTFNMLADLHKRVSELELP